MESVEDYEEIIRGAFKIVESILPKRGYDYININIYPFGSNRASIAFGRSSDLYYTVLLMDDIRFKGKSLEFLIKSSLVTLLRLSVKDLKYEVKKGNFSSLERLKGIDAHVIGIFKESEEIPLREITDFLVRMVDRTEAIISKNLDVLSTYVKIVREIGEIMEHADRMKEFATKLKEILDETKNKEKESIMELKGIDGLNKLSSSNLTAIYDNINAISKYLKTQIMKLGKV
ncbi:hypothetical protein [Sulfurisphaera ohwakuensis]